MSFDTLKIKVGRRPITVIELDLDYCSRTYGSAPCTAVVGTSGTQKCFNTRSTCQDPANYDKTTKTYKFVSENAILPIGENMLPCLKSVNIAPTKLELDRMSIRATATITMQDFSHHDRGFDPYISDRTYSPQKQGTFFGRLRARNPFYVNRVMRIKTGYIDVDRVIYTETRTYFIDEISEPDSRGKVTIKAKDILRAADSEKAKAPAASGGVLDAGMTSSTTSDFDLSPSGIGDSYPSSGYVRIGDEIIAYSGKSGDTLTGITRAQFGTVSDTHDADDTVQECIYYNAKTPPYIINDLLTTYAGIDSSYIPISDWNDEASNWIGLFNSTVVLSEPESVKKLIDEILESCGSTIWWDDLDAEIKFRVTANTSPEATPQTYNDAKNIIQDSVTIKDMNKERISRVNYYFGIRSFIDDISKDNMANLSITIDTDKEGVDEYGETATKEIVSRWVSSTAVAAEIAGRYLTRFKNSPREIQLELDAKDTDLKTGQIADIETRLMQNADGSTRSVRAFVMETDIVEHGHKHKYRLIEVPTNLRGKAYLIAPDTQVDWTSASDSEKDTYMFISDDAGLMSDGSLAPVIV